MSKIEREQKQVVHFQSLRPSDLNLTGINLFSKNPGPTASTRDRPWKWLEDMGFYFFANVLEIEILLSQEVRWNMVFV